MIVGTPGVSGTVATTTPFTLNWTLPVGGAGGLVLGGAGDATAVNVTDCPNDDGLGTALSVVVEGARFTTCVMVAELGKKFVSPLKMAVTEWFPTLRLVMAGEMAW